MASLQNLGVVVMGEKLSESRARIIEPFEGCVATICFAEGHRNVSPPAQTNPPAQTKSVCLQGCQQELPSGIAA